MFSSRTDWDFTPNALSQLAAEKCSQGVQILDLTESNPTRCGISYDPQLFKQLSSRESLRYEPEPHGLLSARIAVAKYYQERGTNIDPANIFLGASTSEAYSELFRLLCNPGESVLVPKPSYPLFDYLCALNDVKVRHYRLAYDDEWRIDLDSLRDAVDSSTRALLLVHPNNPTGSFVKSDEIERILEFVHRNGIALIVDEVFSEYSLKESVGPLDTLSSENNALVFTLNGISKLLGMPQMKIAWITVSGESAVVHDAVRRLEIICDTYLSAATPMQLALPAWLRGGREVTEQIKRRIKANYRSLVSMTARKPVSTLNAEAGWNAILQLPSIMSDDEWAIRTLKENNVIVHPGHYFEIERESCVVVSLLPEERFFLNGIGRVLETVDAGTRTAV